MAQSQTPDSCNNRIMISRSSLALLGTLVLGVILFAFGFALIPIFNFKLNNDLKKAVVIANSSGSKTYSNWAKQSTPMYMEFYFFDLINAESVLKNGSKPVLKEIGPYTYREIRQKNDIEFLANDTTVRYKENKWYVFERNMSVGDESDNFTNVNLPLLTLASKVQYRFGWIIQSVIYYLEKYEGDINLFTVHSVREYLWGYEDPLMKWLKQKLSPFIKINDVVGIYVGARGNGTDDGEYVIYTGQGNVSRLAQIQTYRGSKYLNFWNTSYCNEINGTDGTMYHPFVRTNDVYYVFNSDVCRSIYFTYTRSQTTSISSIPTYRFTVPPAVMANSSVNPDNAGFCTPNCLGSGVLNVSKCYQGTPLIASEPLFREADPKYRDAVIIHNVTSDHQSLLDVEPYTGLTLNAAKRLQINSYLSDLTVIDESKVFENGTVMPAFWITERGTIDDKNTKELYDSVVVPLRLAKIFHYALISVGAVLMLVVVAVVSYGFIKKRQMSRNIQEYDPIA